MQCVNDEIIQPCERSICECNRFFAENYGKMFLDEFKTKNQNFEENNAKCGEISQSNLPNKKYQHDNSNYRYFGFGKVLPPKRCCGKIGERFSYLDDGMKMCCDSKVIFNPLVSECCGGNRIEGVGNC